ncbi:MAG: nucleotidyltransferase family protein [Clostridia bacterium]|nr:nucleotidyltransferase family protein [Clostridia bacterium]
MSEKHVPSQEILSVGRIIIEMIKVDLADTVYMVPADVDFKKLHRLADMHRVVPLIAPAVLRCDGVPEEVKSLFKKELFRVSLRYEAQLKEKRELTHMFSENGIKHCFLKGFKLSQYYKNPEQRFMLDMDVWVEEGKLIKAQEILLERGYEKNSFEDDKDISFIKKPFLNIELHKELKYDYDKGYEFYKGAFGRLAADDDTCELNMTKEDFYVYIVSHSAHHFETAGTGIRNVLDHYYLKKHLKPLCDQAVLESSLDATGLGLFAQRLDKLCECWFEDGEFSDDVQDMADYIMLSGVFGNETNHYMGGILRGDYGDKKSSYLISRLFPQKSKMQDRYPVLKKYPFLLPLLWVVRIFAAIFGKKDISSEINNASSVSQEQKEEFKAFMQKNGL